MNENTKVILVWCGVVNGGGWILLFCRKVGSLQLKMWMRMWSGEREFLISVIVGIIVVALPAYVSFIYFFSVCVFFVVFFLSFFYFIFFSLCFRPTYFRSFNRLSQSQEVRGYLLLSFDYICVFYLFIFINFCHNHHFHHHRTHKTKAEPLGWQNLIHLMKKKTKLFIFTSESQTFGSSNRNRIFKYIFSCFVPSCIFFFFYFCFIVALLLHEPKTRFI